MTVQAPESYRLSRSSVVRARAAIIGLAVTVMLGAFVCDVRAQKGSSKDEGGMDSLWDVDKPKSKAGASKRTRVLGPSVRRESFLRYTVIGGDEAFDRSVVIRGDGTMKMRDEDGATKESRLNASALRQLIKHFSVFDRLQPVYGEKNSDPFQKTTTLVRNVARSPRSQGNRDGTDTIVIYHSDDTILPVEITKMLIGLDRLVDEKLAERTEMKVEFRGIAAAAMLDRYRYPLVMAQPAEPSEMWVHLSVSNLTDEPLLVEFTSEQAYDITIVDETGGERWRWSRNKTFAERPSKVRLVRDWLSYVERIELRDPTGEPFPPGRYTLRYEVLSVPAFRGETQFVIEAEEPKARREDFRSMLSKHRESLDRANDAAKSRKAAAKAAGKGGGKGKRKNKN